MTPVDAYIKNEFKTESVEEAAETAYLLLYGEKEAYLVGNRFELSAEERAKTYSNFSKGAIFLNDTKTGNTNDRISKASKETSESRFIEILYSDFRRRMEEKARVSNSEVSQKHRVRYSLDGDDIPDFLDLWEEYVAEYGVIPKGESLQGILMFHKESATKML